MSNTETSTLPKESLLAVTKKAAAIIATQIVVGVVVTLTVTLLAGAILNKSGITK